MSGERLIPSAPNSSTRAVGCQVAGWYMRPASRLGATRLQGDFQPGYSIRGMAWGTVELEPEVRDWLEGLSTTQFATAAFYVDLLAEQGRC